MLPNILNWQHLAVWNWTGCRTCLYFDRQTWLWCLETSADNTTAEGWSCWGHSNRYCVSLIIHIISAPFSIKHYPWFAVFIQHQHWCKLTDIHVPWSTYVGWISVLRSNKIEWLGLFDVPMETSETHVVL